MLGVRVSDGDGVAVLLIVCGAAPPPFSPINTMAPNRGYPRGGCADELLALAVTLSEGVTASLGVALPDGVRLSEGVALPDGVRLLENVALAVVLLVDVDVGEGVGCTIPMVV